MSHFKDTRKRNRLTCASSATNGGGPITVGIASSGRGSRVATVANAVGSGQGIGKRPSGVLGGGGVNRAGVHYKHQKNNDKMTSACKY